MTHMAQPPIENLDASYRVAHEFALSAREVDVLLLIAAGSSNAEIAGALDESIVTIKGHIRSAYQRIGLERRSQAVAWCFENNIEVHPDARL